MTVKHDDLIDNLDDSLELYESLLVMLKAYQTELQEGSGASADTAKKIIETISAMAKLRHERDSSLTELGYGANREGFILFIESLSEKLKADIRKDFQYLIRLSRECEEQNEINGLILKRNADFVNYAIKQLQQGPGVAPSKTYAPTGVLTKDSPYLLEIDV